MKKLTTLNLMIIVATCFALPAGADEIKTDITAKERPSFSKIDTDQDTNISKEEAKSNEWLSNNFFIIDSNNDGLINPIEFLKAVKNKA